MMCYYCNAPLSPRHEKDHFPVPQRLGGTETVNACLNCHDLKDRIPLDRWPLSFEELDEMIASCPLPVKLMLAKMYAYYLEIMVEGEHELSAAIPVFVCMTEAA